MSSRNRFASDLCYEIFLLHKLATELTMYLYLIKFYFNELACGYTKSIIRCVVGKIEISETDVSDVFILALTT